jgi:hypothetical protein
MSQPTHLPSAPPPVDTAPAYRPLSIMAIASLALAVLFALVLILSGLEGLRRGAPVFLPLWFLALPLTGVVLGLLAQWRIRTSEGTLAGTALARWGVRLGLLTGLGYWSYDFFTGLALQQQANNFLTVEEPDSGFFPRLLKGDLNRAFLLTQPYTRRSSRINPDDNRVMELEFDRPSHESRFGQLTRFRTSEFVQSVLQAGREGRQIQSLGAKSWKYDAGRYRVERIYRISTREGDTDLVVPAMAENDTLSGGRKWFVLWEKVERLPSSQRTPLGDVLQKMRQTANSFMQPWAKGASAGQGVQPGIKDESPKDLREPEGGGGLSPEAALALARQQVTNLFQGKARPPIDSAHGKEHPWLMIPTEQLAPWEEVDGHLRLSYYFAFPVRIRADAKGPPDYLATGTLTLETVGKGDLEHAPPAPAWRVISYRIERVVAVARPNQAEQGSQGGPRQPERGFGP